MNLIAFIKILRILIVYGLTAHHRKREYVYQAFSIIRNLLSKGSSQTGAQYTQSSIASCCVAVEGFTLTRSCIHVSMITWVLSHDCGPTSSLGMLRAPQPIQRRCLTAESQVKVATIVRFGRRNVISDRAGVKDAKTRAVGALAIPNKMS
jgi:hypothetical protein